MDAITSPNCWNSTSNRSIKLIVHLLLLVISFPVASELILPEIRTRQCSLPTLPLANLNQENLKKQKNFLKKPLQLMLQVLREHTCCNCPIQTKVLPSFFGKA